jgi:hypothetical protein
VIEMKVTAVTYIFPSRSNQNLNRDDSENTANRKPPKKEKGKKAIDVISSRKPDEFILSSFAQDAADRRNSDLERTMDD